MRLLRRRSGENGHDRWMVIGLGNPGDRYARTRHNAGVMTLEVLLGRAGGTLKRHKSGCLIAETSLSGKRVTLGRTTSFMNESGRPVRALTDFYRTPIDRCIIIHDEIDLPFGTVRVKIGGGTGGHNGLKSLADHLGTKDFVRVRVGAGRPRGRQDAVEHVLDTFSAAERKELPFLLEEAADAVERVISGGVERAMNEVNTRPESEE